MRSDAIIAGNSKLARPSHGIANVPTSKTVNTATVCPLKPKADKESQREMAAKWAEFLSRASFSFGGDLNRVLGLEAIGR